MQTGMVSFAATDDGLKKTVLKKMEGQVRMTREGRDLAPKNGMMLIPNDEILTAKRSAADVQFPSDEIIRIMQNSKFRINHAEKGSVSVWLPAGKIFSVVSSGRGNEKSFMVVTPFAAASVRGTVFSVQSDGRSESVVMVMDGVVTVSSPAIPGEVIVQARQKTIVKKDAPPMPPVSLTMEEMELFRIISDIAVPGTLTAESRSKDYSKYNPLDDPNLKHEAPGTVQSESLARLTDEFRQSTDRGSPAPPGMQPEPPFPQPDTYTYSGNDTRNAPEAVPDPYYGCPPYCPPDIRGPGRGTDWTKWATDGGRPGTHDKPEKPEKPSQPPPSSGGLSDVTVSSRDIAINIWDHGTVDGDIVNVLLNGRVIHGGGNITLTAEPKALSMRLDAGKNLISIQAVNEGSLPPNTASIRISNVVAGKAEQQYSINQNSNASFSAMVK